MAAKSEKFELVKSYYDRGLWSVRKVRNAVTNPKDAPYITAAEFTEITGEAYQILNKENRNQQSNNCPLVLEELSPGLFYYSHLGESVDISGDIFDAV